LCGRSEERSFYTCRYIDVQLNCVVGEGVPAGLGGDGRMIKPFLLFVRSSSSKPPKKMPMLRQFKVLKGAVRVGVDKHGGVRL